MKAEVKGKRFSRHADVAPERVSEMIALLSTGGISESVRIATNMAAEILKDRGLPHTALLFWDETEQEWKSEAPEDNGGKRGRRLWRHLESMGFDTDSVEGLCGAVIEAAFHWEKADRDTIKESQAFRVGLFYGLLRAYYELIASNKTSAKAKRLKKWAVDYAEDVVRRMPGATFAEIWDCIPEGDQDYGDADLIYRKDNELHWLPKKAAEEILSRRTFERYISRARVAVSNRNVTKL